MKPVPAFRGLREAGFSLTELMVVVVIASILAAIAIPSYTSQVRKSRRTDAKTALIDLASREERFLSLNNQYSNDAAALGYGAAGTAFPQVVGSGYYQVGAVVVAPGPAANPTYTLTATAIGTQVSDTKCRTFTLTSAGAQTAADSGGGAQNDCW